MVLDLSGDKSPQLLLLQNDGYPKVQNFTPRPAKKKKKKKKNTRTDSKTVLLVATSQRSKTAPRSIQKSRKDAKP
jgi:hypothetical protein